MNDETPSDGDDTRADTGLPGRDSTDGRGERQGRWLEDELAAALNRWDYGTYTRKLVLNMEVDVIATSGDPDDRPSDQLVGEAKDFGAQAVRAPTIHRLCMLAFALRSMPVLCTTGRLTKQAWRTARFWDVRVLDYEDLQQDSLPEPDAHVTPPSATDPLARDPLHEIREVPAYMSSPHSDCEGGFDISTGSPRYVPGYDNHGWWMDDASLY